MAAIGCVYLKHNKKRLISIFFIFLILILLTILLHNVSRTMYPLKYEELVAEYSERYDLDPFLVMAVIRTESSFRHNAVSKKNARGLMQITEGTGKWGADKLGVDGYTAEKLFEPELNIHIGCWYLSTLYSEFGDTELVLAAYNAGSGNVSKWLGDSEMSLDGETLDKIPFKETENYIKKVKNSYVMYKKLYENEF